MYALTFQQPYATAALTVKPIDNRPHAPPEYAVGQRIAVHAGVKLDREDAWGLHARLREAFDAAGIARSLMALPKGVVLGTVLLKGYVKPGAKLNGETCEYAARGVYGREVDAILASEWRASGARCLWVLEEPRILKRPIPCAGALGLWRLPEAVEVELRAQEQAALLTLAEPFTEVSP